MWDIDEFLLPAEHMSIPEMIQNALSKWRIIHRNNPKAMPPTSYLARSSYFFDSETMKLSDDSYESRLLASARIKFPASYHMLSHVRRSLKFTPNAVFTKSVHDTSRALGLHAHFALYNLEGKIDRNVDLYHLYPNEEGFLAHYRSKCQGENQVDCEEHYKPFQNEDKTMWKHFEQIYNNTFYVMNKLNFRNPTNQANVKVGIA